MTWQPIETAPKDGLIDVWVDLHGGYRLADAYYDTICGQWRTSRPSNHLVCVPERHVTKWMPLPEPPVSLLGGDNGQPTPGKSQ